MSEERKDYGKQEFKRNGETDQIDSSKRKKKGKEDQDGKGHRDKRQRPNFCNDPSWTIYDQTMLENTASFNYGYPLGSPVTPIGEMPGMAIYRIVPTLSEFTDYNSAGNLAFRAQYMWMRNNITGNFKNYDSNTLAMVVLAITEIHVAMEEARRLYQATTYYNPLDRYTPKSMIKALGFIPNALESERAAFRARFNTLVAQINQLPIPDVYKFRKRWRFTASRIFRDGATAKSQTYAFVREGYFHLDEGGNSGDANGLSELRFHKKSDKEGANFAGVPNNLLTMISTMINKVLNSQAVSLVVADLIRAYPNDLTGVAELSDSEDIRVELNEGIQAQVHNADLLDGRCDLENYVASQIYDEYVEDGGYLSCKLGVTSVADAAYDPLNHIDVSQDKWISMHQANPTPEETMYATRLSCRVDVDERVVKCSGLEVINDMYVFQFVQRNNTATGVSEWTLEWNQIGPSLMFDLSGEDGDTTATSLAKLQTVAVIDDHPRISVDVYPATYQYDSNAIWEIDNFTIIPTSGLELMQYGANLGAFYLNPKTGKSNSR